MTGSGATLRHPVAIAGVVITTVAAVAFLTLLVAELFGLFTNPYAGLVIFVAVPALFVFGLLLIPIGIRLHRRALARNPGASDEWPVVDLRLPRVRAIVIGGVALTVVNATIVLIASQGALHYMESPEFCGQTCHTQMHPQFTAWQNTTHAEVACVQCHVGEGARALVHSKLAGTRQLWHVITGNFPRPIPASQAEMRPANETCGKCHSPMLGHGVLTRTVREYAEDEANTETATTLAMHVGGPDDKTASGRAIHWHADPRIRVEYITTDPDRQNIPFVRVINEKGEAKEYVVEGTTPEALAAGTTRTMDCIDCHNAAAHRISPTAEQAVNRAMAAGRISPALPFARREAVRLLKSDYADENGAMAAIDSGFRAAYDATKASVDQQVLSQAIAATQNLYRANVFPVMKVTWGVYADNLGHNTSLGCFRCHDGSHVARDGSSINADCTSCHDMP